MIRLERLGVPMPLIPTALMLKPEIDYQADKQHAIWLDEHEGKTVMVYGYHDGRGDWTSVAWYDGTALHGDPDHPPGFSNAPVGATLTFTWAQVTEPNPLTYYKWVRRDSVMETQQP